jgi:hypothetical protein
MPPPWVSLPDIVPEEFCRLLNGQHAGVCQSQTTPAVSLRKAYLAMSAVCRKATLRGYDKHKRSVPDKAGANHHAAGTGSYTLPTATCALRSLAPETQRQGALLPRHSQRGGALLPQLPQHQGALLPRYSQRRGALLPQLPQRQGFRPPTPTVKTRSDVRPHVDGRIRRLRACW